MDGVGADDRLEILELRLDRPTLHNLGVQVLIDDDDDRDTHVSLRYRSAGRGGLAARPSSAAGVA